MLELIGVGVTIGSTIGGYAAARRFVRDKLRFVDGAQSRAAPVIAGVGAALVAAPVVWLLPLVGTGTALLFGLGVGAGVAAGGRDVRRGTGYELSSGG